MTWIESHSNLRDHPKLKRLSRMLGVDRRAATGLLHWLWWWAMDYAPDGDLSRYEDADIADGLDWDGDPTELMAALRDAGFLDGAKLHDWEEYGEKLYRKRQANAQRMKDRRASHVHNTCTTRSDHVGGLEDREDREDKLTDIHTDILSGETPDRTAKRASRAAVIRGRYDHWRSVYPQETAQLTLTKDRARAISGRLSEGIAPETIDEAVTNTRSDPWWTGAKDGEWKADIKAICGKGSTVENLAARTKIVRHEPQPDPRAREKRIAKAKAQLAAGYPDAARAMVFDDEWDEVRAS